MGKKYNLIGQTFGDWRVIESSGHNSNGGLLWLCECVCGMRKVHSTSALCGGVTRRCRNCYKTPTNKYDRNGDTVTVFCSNGKSFKIDFSDLELVRKYQWFQSGYEGYITAKKGQKKILLHRLLMSASALDIVDHISGDIFDNRRSNLRLCNKQQNKRNEKIRKDNKSGYKGVTWHRECKKYMASIRANGRTQYLGVFYTSVEAAIAYDNAAKKIFGEFARLNFPNSDYENTKEGLAYEHSENRSVTA